MTFGSELLLFAVGLLRVLPTVYCVCEGDEINTKIRVADGGFAFAWMVVPTVGKRVFLRVVSTIPTVMRGMTPPPRRFKKRPPAVQKVRLSPVQKQLLIGGTSPCLSKAPPQALPKGREFLLAEFEDVVWCSFLLGKVGKGPAGGWYAPLATLTE